MNTTTTNNNTFLSTSSIIDWWRYHIFSGVVAGVLQQAVICSIFLFVVEIVLVKNGRFWTNKKNTKNQQQQIQPDADRFAKIWSHEIPHAIWTVSGGYIIKLMIRHLIENGGVNVINIPPDLSLSSSLSSSSTTIIMLLIRWIIEVVTYFIVFDAYFYFIHRLFHTNKYLYHWIHKAHHESISPNAVAGVSFNPLEGTLFGSFLPMYSYICTQCTGGILKPTLITCGGLQLLQSLMIHCGYEFVSAEHFEHTFWSKFLTPTFHDRHHERFNCNYSGFFTYLDDLFGTCDPDWKTKYASWQRHGRRRRCSNTSSSSTNTNQQQQQQDLLSSSKADQKWNDEKKTE